jgi:hypothetical protein
VERQKHMQMYPHWNARDNYRYGAKKKKRKRDKNVPGSATGSGHGHVASGDHSGKRNLRIF